MGAVVDSAVWVLVRQDQLLVDVGDRKNLSAHLVRSIATILWASALYGAVLGWWRSPLMSAYAAIKLPLLLLSTGLLTMTANWLISAGFRMRLSFAQVSVLTTSALATTSLMLASLAPVALLFTLCAPTPTDQARDTHNALFVAHTALLAGCGLLGTATLWRSLTMVTRGARDAWLVYLAWLAIFAFVAGELGWLLRPFVGSVYLPVTFLRGDSLDRNVYEFIWTDIVVPRWTNLD